VIQLNILRLDEFNRPIEEIEEQEAEQPKPNIFI